MTAKGALVAAGVAGLFASSTPAVAAPKEGKGTVHCMGINDCKGKGMCKSATSSCQGMNSCKGKGWIDASAKDCKDKGGTVAAGK